MALQIVTSQAMREDLVEGYLSEKGRRVSGSDYQVVQSTADRAEPLVAEYGEQRTQRQAARKANVTTARALASSPGFKLIPRTPQQMVSMKASAAHNAVSNYVYNVVTEAARSGIVHPVALERIIFALALAFTNVLGKPAALGQSVPVLHWLYAENAQATFEKASQEDLVALVKKQFPDLPDEAVEAFVLSYKTESPFVFTPKDVERMKTRLRRSADATKTIQEMLTRVLDTNKSTGRIYNGPRMSEQDLLWRVNHYTPDELQPLLSLVVEANRSDDTIRRASHPWIDVFAVSSADHIVSQPPLGPGILDMVVVDDDDDEEDDDFDGEDEDEEEEDEDEEEEEDEDEEEDEQDEEDEDEEEDEQDEEEDEQEQEEEEEQDEEEEEEEEEVKKKEAQVQEAAQPPTPSAVRSAPPPTPTAAKQPPTPTPAVLIQSAQPATPASQAQPAQPPTPAKQQTPTQLAQPPTPAKQKTPDQLAQPPTPAKQKTPDQLAQPPTPAKQKTPIQPAQPPTPIQPAQPPTPAATPLPRAVQVSPPAETPATEVDDVADLHPTPPVQLLY